MDEHMTHIQFSLPRLEIFWHQPVSITNPSLQSVSVALASVEEQNLSRAGMDPCEGDKPSINMGDISSIVFYHTIVFVSQNWGTPKFIYWLIKIIDIQDTHKLDFLVCLGLDGDLQATKIPMSWQRDIEIAALGEAPCESAAMSLNIELISLACVGSTKN